MAEQFTLIPACKSSIALVQILKRWQSSISNMENGAEWFRADIQEQLITDTLRRL
jgi:hypothetical protein